MIVNHVKNLAVAVLGEEKRVLINKKHGLPKYIFDILQHLKCFLVNLNLFFFLCRLVSCFVIIHAVIEYAHHT